MKLKAPQADKWPKKIIHVDMDAFYAAIEQRDRPELRGKPVVVGGSPQSRGVVSTCSYEARKFGIRSAMPAAQAKKLCPQAIFVTPSFEKYQKVSQSIRAIFHQHTDLVEPMSLDEAYLDVTQHRFALKDPVAIAGLIKQSIFAVTKLTASAGVAPNLFLAKIASDFNKPNGLTVVPPEEIDLFLENLPVRKIPGVGPVTEAHLLRLGLKTCQDLRDFGRNALIREFGKSGIFLFERAHGRDDREVEPNLPSKQYSSEETFSKDTRDIAWLEKRLQGYAEEIFSGLKSEGRMGRTITLKVKYHDFELVTRSKTLLSYPKSADEVYEIARELLKTKTLAGKKAIRLLGLGISQLDDLSMKKVSQQPDLFSQV